MSQNVLIVEDEYLIALDMEAALEDAGYVSAGIASTREEVHARVRKTRPEIALIDLHLADGLTGPLIGEELGRMGIRVVFVTANPAMVSAGVPHALGVVEKPTDDETLLEVVQWVSSSHIGSSAARLPRGFQPFGA